MKLNTILLALGSTSLALAASVPRQSVSITPGQIQDAAARLQQAQNEMNNLIGNAASNVRSINSGFSGAASSAINQALSDLDISMSNVNQAIGQIVAGLSEATQTFQQVDQGAAGLFGR